MDISGFIDSFSKYIVRPANAFGLGGFVFDVANDTTIFITTEITDHYTEDNSTIQDHIAVKPKRVTLSNYVGELVYRLDDSTNTPVQNVVQKLTTLSAYLPKITAGVAQAQNVLSSNKKINTIKDIGITQAVDLWAMVKKPDAANATPATGLYVFQSPCRAKDYCQSANAV